MDLPSLFPLEVSMELRHELQHALDQEQTWRDWLSKQDNGSYCESAGYESKAGSPVVDAYNQLVDVLLVFQRTGIKGP